MTKINRKYLFPDLLHFTDFVLAVFSWVLLDFSRTQLFQDIGGASGPEFDNYRLLFNISNANQSTLEYSLAVVTICLIIRTTMNLQFVESIGPLIKILGKMSVDFVNFCILYLVLVLMFTLLGNINYLVYLDEYDGFMNSLITVIDASIGKYDFKAFEMEDKAYQYMGQIYMMVVVICFQILLFNLIVALLSKTYNIYENRSNGLFLKKILSKRDELIDDEFCGSFLVSIPPLDALQILFVPVCVFLKYGSKQLKRINDFLMLA